MKDQGLPFLLHTHSFNISFLRIVLQNTKSLTVKSHSIIAKQTDGGKFLKIQPNVSPDSVKNTQISFFNSFVSN